MTQDPKFRPYDTPAGEPMPPEVERPEGSFDARERKSIEVERRPEGFGGDVQETARKEPPHSSDKPASSGPLSEDAGVTLLGSDKAVHFRERWKSIQTSFVDEPRQAVTQAEQLLDEVFRTLTDAFSRQRSEMESQWDRGGEVMTEDMRMAIRRYRTLFERLLAA